MAHGLVVHVTEEAQAGAWKNSKMVVRLCFTGKVLDIGVQQLVHVGCLPLNV